MERTDHLTDELIARAAAGDVAAREEIYRSTAGFVYNVALGVTGAPEAAEDVTQEVFIAAFAALSGFAGRAALRTWLYRVAVNRALNARRSRARRPGSVQIEDVADTLADPASLEQDVERAHERAHCLRLLAQLPAEQRACVVLRDLQGLDYAEIAAVLGTNINTVRTRLHRARERLLAAADKEGLRHGL